MSLNDILVLQNTARFYDVLHRVFNLINYHTGKACAEILAILIYVTYILRYIFYSLKSVISVPHSKSGLVPRSSLSGAGQLGLGSWKRAGQLGEGRGKQGQFTSNLRRRRTIPVTAGGCQVSVNGVQREARGTEREKQKKLRHVYM